MGEGWGEAERAAREEVKRVGMGFQVRPQKKEAEAGSTEEGLTMESWGPATAGEAEG